MKKNNPYQQLSTSDNQPDSTNNQPNTPKMNTQQSNKSADEPAFALKNPGSFDKPGQDQLYADEPNTGGAKGSPAGNTIKDPKEWTTGDEPMTGAQRSYLHTLAGEAGEQIPDDLTKAEASENVRELVFTKK